MELKFRATDEQAKAIAANAIKASAPMGMGFMHFDASEEITPESVTINEDAINLDYFHGRMVKLYMRKDGDHWVMPDRARPDYQSWVRKYPTCAELIKSVDGVELV